MVDSEQSSQLSGDPDPSPLTSSTTPSVHPIHRNSFHHHQEQVNHHPHHHEHPFGHLNQQEEHKQLQDNQEQHLHQHQHQLTQYLTATHGNGNSIGIDIDIGNSSGNNSGDHLSNHLPVTQQQQQQDSNINEATDSSNVPINQCSFPSSSSTESSSFKFDVDSPTSPDSIQGTNCINVLHSNNKCFQSDRSYSSSMDRNSPSVIHMESQLNDSYLTNAPSPPESISGDVQNISGTHTPCGTAIRAAELVPKCNTNDIESTSGKRINITVNPLVERTSAASKNLYRKIKKNLTSVQSSEGERGESRNKEATSNSQDKLSTKSLSIDSYYITPTTANPQRESVEKLIMATNIFIFCAFVAAIILAIVIIWLALGLTSNDTSTTGNGSTEVSGFSTGGVTTTNGRITTGRGPICKSLRVPLCHKFRVGYSYTSLPNSFGQLDQESISSDLMQFEKLFGVKCYSLLPLFICSIYAPKCIPNVNFGHAIPPCKSLCQEARRKCDFFLRVFSLKWPKSSFMNCDKLPDSTDPEVCVGFREHQLLVMKSQDCRDGFRCDVTRCVPRKWVCDGFIDCQDGSDERNCSYCSYDEFHCGSGVCIRREDICDGIKDCPDGRDERQCLRLNKKMGSYGEGRLEAWSAVSNTWQVVCGEKWDEKFMSDRACRKLGYRRANNTNVVTEATNAIGPKNTFGHGQTKSFFHKGRKGGGCDTSHVSVHLTCSQFECGRTAVSYEPTARIVGGKESLPGSWPWLVGLHGGQDEVFFCGGILISEHWVLSAAHCVGNQTNPQGWTIHLGLTRRTASPVFVRRRTLSAIIKHEDFNSNNSYGNDIALLLLSEAVNFDEFLRPVCLPPKTLELPPKTKCTVVGWGRDSHDEVGDYSNVIHEVTVPIIHHSDCAKWYLLQDIKIGNTMLCAGYEEGEKDACQGDSGGPLVCKSSTNGAYFVAGIVSWGINCAQPNLPGIYTKVSIYREWINNVTDSFGYPLIL